MPTLNYAVNISGLGGSIARSTPRTADGGVSVEIALPAGKAGQLTTRTDNETGTLTMATGHGITTGQIIDLRWATGVRYGITVGTVSGLSVPIGADNSGDGDNLPSNLTNIVACVQVPFNVAIDGDELSLIGLQALYASNSETSKVLINFIDEGDAGIVALSLDANTPRVFDVEGGDSNPFGSANPIVAATASNGSSANAATIKILAVQDATP